MGSAVTHAPAREDLDRDSEPRHGPVKSRRPADLKRRGRRENLAGYLFMSPWIAGFLLLTAGPMVASLYFAFTDYNLFDAPRWIGLDNFSEMFGDPRWRHSVQVTLWYVVVGTRSSCSPRSVWPCCWRRNGAGRPSTGPPSTPRR